MRTSSTIQQEASPLLNLPPELRNRIYSYALVEPDPVHIFCHALFRYAQGLGKEGLDDPTQHFYWHPPGLLQTCRQIRDEVSELYYGSNNFIAVYDEVPWAVGLKKWLGALERVDLRSLTYVGVDFNEILMFTMTHPIDDVRDLFRFWRNLQDTDLAVEKEVLMMFLPVLGPNSESASALSEVFDSCDISEWQSVAQLERRIPADLLWEDDLNELSTS